jgi:1,4-alpha-glucan branching enzyme
MMMFRIFLLFGIFTTSLNAQILEISPAFPTVNDVVTIIYDATKGNGALTGVNQVYCHTGLITTASTSPSNWLFVQGNWGQVDANVQMTPIGNNKHSITIDIDAFYGFPVNTTVLKLAFVFRNANGSIVGREADGSDIFYDVYPVNGGLQAAIFNPTQVQLVGLNQTFPFKGQSNQPCLLTLKEDGVLLSSINNATLLNYTVTAGSPGTHTLMFEADNGSTVIQDSVIYTVNPPVTYQNPPVGIKNGVNHINDSTVIFQLYAPEKQHVYLLGDFNGWLPLSNYHMNCSLDSTRWWLTVGGLQAGQTYAYQYLIEGQGRYADPVSTLVLDPNNDSFIGNTTFPNLHPYPTGLTTGVVSLFETVPPSYAWQNASFNPPAKKDLVIYELLIRDFVAARNYQTLIDTIAYLDRLGINAIELMPNSEFEGNESWGYNPAYHMALDKYYGTPEKFKEFVDTCHGRGIAVIIDMVLNHAFGQNPMVNMYWDAVNNRPAANNPWFNAICPHPPNCWGYDFNHSSNATKEYIDQVNRHWVQEYNIDGFRFDFTKGFANTSASYSLERINNIKRMADTIWALDPDQYIILEHWCDNNEEEQLADYGCMLWGNVTHGYQNSGKGFPANSSLSNGIYTNRTWNLPHLITYMESHDEQRLMYEAITFGNASNPAHNAKDPYTALGRMQGLAVTFFSQPGPRMIWQFGEYGYDVNIDFPCRVCNKPILWNYLQQGRRQQLLDVYKAMLSLRNNYETFRSLDFQASLGAGVKRMIMNHPSMNGLSLVNIDVSPISATPAFQHTGWWYEYFTGDSINVTNVNAAILLQPGEYRVYTDVLLPKPTITSVASLEELENPGFEFSVYPVPLESTCTLKVHSSEFQPIEIQWYDGQGSLVQQHRGLANAGENLIPFDNLNLNPGTYLVLVRLGKSLAHKTVVK